MNVKKIVEQYLEKNCFDGLYRDDCGCALPDLIPCSECDISECQPGYKNTHSVSRSWLVCGEKNMTDEQIIKFIEDN